MQASDGSFVIDSAFGINSDEMKVLLSLSLSLSLCRLHLHVERGDGEERRERREREATCYIGETEKSVCKKRATIPHVFFIFSSHKAALQDIFSIMMTAMRAR